MSADKQLTTMHRLSLCIAGARDELIERAQGNISEAERYVR